MLFPTSRSLREPIGSDSDPLWQSRRGFSAGLRSIRSCPDSADRTTCPSLHRTIPAAPSLGLNFVAILMWSGSWSFSFLRHDGSAYATEAEVCSWSTPLQHGTPLLFAFGRMTAPPFLGLRRSILATMRSRFLSSALEILSMSQFRYGDTFVGDTLHSGTKGLMVPICLKLM